MARSRDDLRLTLENVERSLVRTLDEVGRAAESARRLLDYLERDPAALIRGKGEEPR
jgi:hypothetical protein